MPSRIRAESQSGAEKGIVNDDQTTSGRIVVIVTRWHEDDIASRILKQDHDRWRVRRNAFMLDAMASCSLCASTNAVMYWTSISRAKASMLLPFTSLQKAATASR